MEFGELLTTIRREKKLTQQEVSELINTSPQNVSHYEKNRRTCTFDQGVQILKALGIDILIENGKIEKEFRKMKKYFDVNGEEIKEGMKLKCLEDGDIQEVYLADDGDLGFNATNEDFVGYNPFTVQLYPLSEFDMREWQIIKK